MDSSNKRVNMQKTCPDRRRSRKEKNKRISTEEESSLEDSTSDSSFEMPPNIKESVGDLKDHVDSVVSSISASVDQTNGQNFATFGSNPTQLNEYWSHGSTMCRHEHTDDLDFGDFENFESSTSQKAVRTVSRDLIQRNDIFTSLLEKVEPALLKSFPTQNLHFNHQDVTENSSISLQDDMRTIFPENPLWKTVLSSFGQPQRFNWFDSASHDLLRRNNLTSPNNPKISPSKATRLSNSKFLKPGSNHPTVISLQESYSSSNDEINRFVRTDPKQDIDNKYLSNQ